LLGALAGLVEHPAVLHAAEAMLFRNSVGEIYSAVRANGIDQAVGARAVFVENEILTEQANRLGGALGQFACGGDGVPVAPEERSHRGAWAYLCQSFILCSGQHFSPPVSLSPSIDDMGGATANPCMWRATLRLLTMSVEDQSCPINK